MRASIVNPYLHFWSGPLEGQQHMDGLGRYCSNSIANALELLQSCTKPSIQSQPDINAFHSDYLTSLCTHTCSLWIRSLDGQYYIKSIRYHIINDTILFSGNNWFIIWRKYKYPKIRWLIDITPPFSFSSHDSHLFSGKLMHLISAPDFIFVIITSMYITQLHFCWSKTSTLGQHHDRTENNCNTSLSLSIIVTKPMPNLLTKTYLTEINPNYFIIRTCEICT